MSGAVRWILRLTRSRRGMAGLFTASVAETTVVPVPMEAVIVPMMLADRRRIWRIAAVTLAGCLAGALVGYAVGYLVFESVGLWLLDRFGWAADFTEFQAVFATHGFWAIVLVGVTPIPFQIAMLAAGFSHYPLVLFLLACALARGVRYFGLALLVTLFGDRLRRWLGRRRAAGRGRPAL